MGRCACPGSQRRRPWPASTGSATGYAASPACRRHGRRLISLARWAFPDVWSAFAGSQPTAVAVLTRWPDLRALGSARRATLTGVVAAHTRGVPDVPARVEAIRVAARAWTGFWEGHLDLDALAWEVAEHLHDMAEADQRIARATAQATRYWADLYGDDPLLLSVPGMGPMTAPTVRAFLGDGGAFTTAKAAGSYVGMNPSTWSSGTVVQPSRAITKEGPAVLRLAFYQAAGGARRVAPQLAAFYRHLMVDRGHSHTKATVAVARKLIERTWTVLHRDQPYQLRDIDGDPTPVHDAHLQARIADLERLLAVHEQTVDEQADRMELIVQGSQMGTWDWEIPTGRVTFNERWANMLGYRLDELEPHVRTWEQLVHPDDLHQVMATVSSHLRGETPTYSSEHRLRTKSGAWCWVFDSGRVVKRDTKGGFCRGSC